MRLLGKMVFATLLLVACGSESGGMDASPDGAMDGPMDGPGNDASADAATDGSSDAMLCRLPSQTIACTIGNDQPCTASCAGAYCYSFMMVGSVCTQSCNNASQCPSGWTCNNMGRCRPPG